MYINAEPPVGWRAAVSPYNLPPSVTLWPPWRPVVSPAVTCPWGSDALPLKESRWCCLMGGGPVTLATDSLGPYSFWGAGEPIRRIGSFLGTQNPLEQLNESSNQLEM